MKKLIALLLVLIIAFSITACDGSGNNTTTEPPTINNEELKENWKAGEVVFPNGKSATLPCTVKEIKETSELDIYNSANITKITLKPDETQTFYLVNDNTRIEIKCKNTTDVDVNIMDSTVVKYSFNGVKPGNRKIKFEGGLTIGVTQADVETALGVPEGNTTEEGVYIYKGRNSKNKKIELRVGFNSSNAVVSVVYEVNM